MTWHEAAPLTEERLPAALTSTRSRQAAASSPTRQQHWWQYPTLSGGIRKERANSGETSLQGISSNSRLTL